MSSWTNAILQGATQWPLPTVYHINDTEQVSYMGREVTGIHRLRFIFSPAGERATYRDVLVSEYVLRSPDGGAVILDEVRSADRSFRAETA